MRPVRIPTPSPEQLDALDEMYRTTRHARLRTRAQMVLLAAERRLGRRDRRDRPREQGDGKALAQALLGRRSRGLARCSTSGRVT